MKPYRFDENKESSIDVGIEPPQTLHWVVREDEDLEMELNAFSKRSPMVTEGLINRVMRCIEKL
jgi:hypothetical protein